MAKLPEIRQGVTYETPYFPTTMQAFIFRVWEFVPCAKIAEVLETTPETVECLAKDMGLKPQKNTEEWREKGYISILRNVWQILPYEQIFKLLDWDDERLAYILKEDDFLDVKFGWFKFDCPKVLYKPLTDAEKTQTEKIKETMEKYVQPIKDVAAPFDFFTSHYKSLSDARTFPVQITNEWCMKNYAGDAVSDCAEDFCAELKEKYDITLSETGGKAIALYTDLQSEDAEYHEISVTKAGIEIHAAKPEGVLRALYFLLQAAEDNGACAFYEKEYKRTAVVKTRLIYSFCGLYGDVLDVDNRVSFPDRLLKNYAKCGINGVWIQAVLYKITPFPYDAKQSLGWEKRLENLSNLIARAKRYGIKVYLYLNEPRGMPHSFFDKFPHLKGRTYHDGLTCLCTSNPEIHAYLRNALTTLCKSAPELGGFFNISMSENLTHCYSREMHPGDEMCPVCAKRTKEDVTAEVITVMANAVKQASPGMRFFAWSWAWERMLDMKQIEKLVHNLPDSVILMNVSENHLEYEKSGVKGKVLDYSLSMPGPSAWSEQLWEMGRKKGLETAAKMQINNSWECSTAPFLPVFKTVMEHVNNLKAVHVEHMMLSWTLGGYPSDNIKIASSAFFQDSCNQEDVYETVLKNSYGKYAGTVKEAAAYFSDAFKEFPFSIDTLYTGPQNAGVANPMFPKPSGLGATMTCYAYDDLKSWCGPYPPEILEAQFKKLCDIWEKGLISIKDMPVSEFTDMAVYGYTLFKASYNQIRYCRIREDENAKAEQTEILKNERELAIKALEIMCRNSSVGYEAANHYYVTKSALAEKILLVTRLLEQNNQ